MRKGVAAFLGAGWLAIWVWAFGFRYSDSFFQYNLGARLPVFIAALIGVAVIPCCAYLQLRRFGSVIAATVRQSICSIVATLPLVVISYALSRASGPFRLSGDDAMGAGILSRASGPFRLSGDDAMGAGIDLFLLICVSLISVGAVSAASFIKRTRTAAHSTDAQ